jgi:hypothetical protein
MMGIFASFLHPLCYHHCNSYKAKTMAVPARMLHTFLVRLWRDRARGEWRGQITHVQTGRRRTFRQLSELLTAMEELAPGLGGTDPRSPDDPAGETGGEKGE